MAGGKQLAPDEPPTTPRHVTGIGAAAAEAVSPKPIVVVLAGGAPKPMVVTPWAEELPCPTGLAEDLSMVSCSSAFACTGNMARSGEATRGAARQAPSPGDRRRRAPARRREARPVPWPPPRQTVSQSRARRRDAP